LARKKCLIIYLRAKGYSRCEIADIARVDEDTVTNHVKIFADSGLQGLLKANYYKPKSQLEPYVEQLKKLFEKNPPHTVNHAIELIFEQTGVRLKHSACQAFLKKMGMKCRRCGLVPGKANDDKEQQEAQQEFHDQKLQPRLGGCPITELTHEQFCCHREILNFSSNLFLKLPPMLCKLAVSRPL